MIVNALTIDVEDYFQVHAFSSVIRKEDWDSFEPTVEKNTYRILDLLDACSPTRNSQLYPVECEAYSTGVASCNPIKATFFILGWIAERYPALVKEIHARGHEVACHGYAHKCIFDQTRDEFAEDVKRAKGILEDLIGDVIIGYRAPTYSITKETLWALEILLELGFRYDSSIFPIKHDVYGFPEAPRFPCVIILNGNNRFHFKMLNDDKYNDGRWITEFTMATIRALGQNLPVAGGGYFRLFPYCVTRGFLTRINSKEAKPFVFCIHPWELDPNLPKIKGVGMLSKFRSYVNLHKTERRFRRLLSDFCFAPLSDLFMGHEQT